MTKTKATVTALSSFSPGGGREWLGETVKDLVRKRGVVRTPGAGRAKASFSIQPRPPAPFCPSAESWLGWVLPRGLRWSPRAPTRTSGLLMPLHPCRRPVAASSPYPSPPGSVSTFLPPEQPPLQPPLPPAPMDLGCTTSLQKQRTRDPTCQRRPHWKQNTEAASS